MPELTSADVVYAGSAEAVRAYVGDTLVAQMFFNTVANPSPQVDDTGWGVDDGGETVTFTAARDATSGVDGDYGYTVEVATGSIPAGSDAGVEIGSGGADEIPVVEGDEIFPSAWVRSSVANSLELQVRFYTGAGALVSTEVVPDSLTLAEIATYVLVGGGSVPVPATAERAAIRVVVGADGVAMGVGDTLDVDHATTAQGDYFDGDTDGVWTGTPYASTSKSWREPVI